MKPNPVNLNYQKHLYIITVVYSASASLSPKKKNQSSSVYFIPVWKIFKEYSNQNESIRIIAISRNK